MQQATVYPSVLGVEIDRDVVRDRLHKHDLPAIRKVIEPHVLPLLRGPK